MPRFIATIDCPHCGTTKAGMMGETAMPTNNGDIRVPLSCPHCTEVVVMVCNLDRGGYQMRTAGNANVIMNLQDPNSPVTTRGGHYPAKMERKVPKDVPARIGSSYEEALDNFKRARYETCILLCGKTIDLSTKSMDPTWSLEKRIKQLANDAKITNEMAEWAQEIRLDRNTAIHEEIVFTEDQAESILSFTEAFLNYVYTLPQLVSRHRAAKEKGTKP